MPGEFKTNKIKPCQCGFKPDHYSLGYSSTPYDIWCPNCKKQLNNARCRCTGMPDHAIDYWNKHLRHLTKRQMEGEITKLINERIKVQDKYCERFKFYDYYWEKGNGEVLYERW